MNRNFSSNVVMDNWEKRWPILFLKNNSGYKIKCKCILEGLNRTKLVENVQASKSFKKVCSTIQLNVNSRNKQKNTKVIAM